MANTKVDPPLVSIFQRRFESISEEMALSLLRTAKSPIFGEGRDFVTGLYDAKGGTLGQAEYQAVLVFSIPTCLEHIISYYGDEIYPGDVIIHNDVFSGGGQLPDIGIFSPIFYKDKLVAFACAKGHVADIGGAVAGGHNPFATDVWAEGIRIPPLKVYEKGKFRKDVWDFLFANIRFPFVADDIRAEIGGTSLGKRKLVELIDRYGLDTYETHVNALYDASEMMFREQIALMPDGVYKGESTIHNEEKGDSTVRVTITIVGSDITFDFTGSSPAASYYINCPRAAAIASVWLTMLMLIDEVPHTAGIFRALHVITPEGFIGAPFGTPTVLGNHVSNLISNSIINALAEAIPDRVFAAWHRDYHFSFNGIDPRTGEAFADIDFLASKGGAGAVRGVDGYDAIGIIATCGAYFAQDYEMLEFHDPVFLRANEYSQDSAGAGQWRGGLGVYTSIDFGAETTSVSIWGMHGTIEEERAFGLFGGKKGSLNKIMLKLPGESEKQAKPFGLYSLPKGTNLQKWAGGGGGFGDPYLRDAEIVLAEVRNEFVSINGARDDYGVVIEGNVRYPNFLRINWEETERLRSSRSIASGE